MEKRALTSVEARLGADRFSSVVSVGVSVRVDGNCESRSLAQISMRTLLTLRTFSMQCQKVLS